MKKPWIAVDPAASNAESESALIVYKLDENGKAEIYSPLCFQIVHKRVHARLTAVSLGRPGGGIFGGCCHR